MTHFGLGTRLQWNACSLHAAIPFGHAAGMVRARYNIPLAHWIKHTRTWRLEWWDGMMDAFLWQRMEHACNHAQCQVLCNAHEAPANPS
eukprot:493914-Rhodomonas_salina.3